ncbi:transglutaminase-like putative cysteine protease [Cytobacillus oceanisediminis]|uniref:Transglutaminase-like putative cysteine protease n=1 Tax=Cytobacillus oceanisediminis TaxID=665099 RepID=A0A2V2ZFH6_9BACI|nr:transglutaminase domain-containing protein [Cytobacillus oceanisediminis]PWW17606.1 transglutaminase-like putative cysteine protease [Cytobacillus oceanisediminis]
MTSQKVQKDLATFLLYVLGFLLLWEWLRPLEQLTDTSNITVFLVFLMLSLLMSFYSVSPLLSGFIKVLYVVYVLHFLYFEGAFFQTSWISPFWEDLKHNFSLIADRDWPSITNLFRSLLFFVLLGLMTYLIQYWLISRRQIFIFFFMTLIYITVLDTFTPYVANGAIVRTVIAGFAVMGILTFYRLLDKEGIKKEVSLSRKWMVPLALLIAVSAGLGFAAPKAEPMWPDPVPFIKSYGQNSGGDGSGIQKIGYGEDDSRLGGPFIGDSGVVFRAEVESRHYWKVETKDTYTGKGWVTSQPEEEFLPFGMGEDIPVSSFIDNDAIETTEETSSVYTFMNYPHVVYPLGVKSIDAPPFITYELETATEKIRTLDGGRPVALDQYKLRFEVPKYSVTALKSAETNAGVLPDEFLARYTQLPDELPNRVRELALEITQDKTDWFEKARELERYFRRSEYNYDQQDVAVPDEDEDYVDQFLFDTKQGYCDNFSSSMAVMARSIGLPARWVKGYTEGEFQQSTGSGLRLFEVTNNNAHSWVEIYFPEIGWVPFEPTQGFSNNIQFNFDNAGQNTNQAEAEEPKETETPVKPEKPEEKVADESSFSIKEVWESVKAFFADNLKVIGIAILTVALLIFMLYQKRGKWLPHYFVLRFKQTEKDEHFPKAYLILLKELDRYGLKRKNGQTLREYAKYVDSFFSTKEMSRLTSRYEELIYRGVLKEGSWTETKELWENLIKKTMA